jgi:hypothetical protein
MKTTDQSNNQPVVLLLSYFSLVLNKREQDC